MQTKASLAQKVILSVYLAILIIQIKMILNNLVDFKVKYGQFSLNSHTFSLFSHSNNSNKDDFELLLTDFKA